MITPEKFPGAEIDPTGVLRFGGADTLALAKKYRTPLYVMDEDVLRANCREFRRGFEAAYPGETRVLYSAKAMTALEVMRTAADEGLGLDASSMGEVRGALLAGIEPGEIYLHGGFKKEQDLRDALRLGVGTIVLDSRDEALTLERLARASKRKPAVLLRVTPGIEAHTHHFIQTGRLDTKFGVPIAGGAALSLIAEILRSRSLELRGFHYHIGSQILDLKPYREAARRAADFIASLKSRLGYVPAEVNAGGSFPARYSSRQALPDVRRIARAVAGELSARLRESGVPLPRLVVEPGRAIAGPAGITLYTVGPVKTVPGVRSYVIVDGGLSDNPRPALYGAAYEAVIAGRASAPPDGNYRVCGSHCENDVLIKSLPLPSPRPGDVLAVFTTGAYNFSMSSNYNKFPRPAVVMLKNGKPRLIVKRETDGDLFAMDVITRRARATRGYRRPMKKSPPPTTGK
ncbi:MAG: diaminopimelate decarboxylase [bacterium]